MNGPVPLCPNCHTWHAASQTCPAFTNQQEQRRVEQEFQKAADDEDARRVAEYKAKRRGKQK